MAHAPFDENSEDGAPPPAAVRVGDGCQGPARLVASSVCARRGRGRYRGVVLPREHADGELLCLVPDVESLRLPVKYRAQRAVAEVGKAARHAWGRRERIAATRGRELMHEGDGRHVIDQDLEPARCVAGRVHVGTAFRVHVLMHDVHDQLRRTLRGDDVVLLHFE